MEEKFKIEIISPEKIVFSQDSEMVTLPSYEGDMSILKNHIPIIALLRPGIIKVKKNIDSYEDFFVEDGIVKFYNDSLSILSTIVIHVKDLSKNYLENISKRTLDKLNLNSLTDGDKYVLNHKLDTIKSISVQLKNSIT